MPFDMSATAVPFGRLSEEPSTRSRLGLDLRQVWNRKSRDMCLPAITSTNNSARDTSEHPRCREAKEYMTRWSPHAPRVCLRDPKLGPSETVGEKIAVTEGMVNRQIA